MAIKVERNEKKRNEVKEPKNESEEQVCEELAVDTSPDIFTSIKDECDEKNLIDFPSSSLSHMSKEVTLLHASSTLDKQSKRKTNIATMDRLPTITDPNLICLSQVKQEPEEEVGEDPLYIPTSSFDFIKVEVKDEPKELEVSDVFVDIKYESTLSVQMRDEKLGVYDKNRHSTNLKEDS